VREARPGGWLIAKVSKKKTIRNVAIFAILVGSLYLLLPQLVDAEQTIALLSRADYLLLGLALLLEVAAILSYANLTRYILRVLDIRMRLIEVLSITLSSLAVSHLLSAGGVGGWVVTYNSLMKRKVPHGLIFVAIAAQQFFNYIVLWFVFAFALIYLVVARGQSLVTYAAAIVLIVLLLWLTGYGVYLYRHRARMRFRLGQIAALVNRIAHRSIIEETHIDGWLDNLFAGMRRLTTRKGAVRKTALFACGYWVFDLLCLWVCLLAFDYHLGIGYVIVSYIVAYAVGTLAPTPGGLGAIEGLLIALFVSFGVPSATAVTVVLVYRLINFWLPIIPGLIAYAAVRPGRTPATRTEIEQASEEECVRQQGAMAAEACEPMETPAGAAGPASSPRPRAGRRRTERPRAEHEHMSFAWLDTLRHHDGNGKNGKGSGSPAVPQDAQDDDSDARSL
jgi:uncharacterized protein (TIRG00374 family)